MADLAGMGEKPTHASSNAAAALFALLDALSVVSRRMHPPRIAALAMELQAPAAALRQAQALLIEPPLQEAAALALRACDNLLTAEAADNPVADAYRAMRYYQRAQAQLVAAEALPAVSAFLLPPDRRQDAAVRA